MGIGMVMVKICPPKFAYGYKPANELFKASGNTRGTYIGSAMQGFLASQARIERLIDMSMSL